MRPSAFVLVCLLAGSAVSLLDSPLAAQRGADSKAAPIKITAEDLARECAADRTKAEARYAGKTLRVTGVVGMIHDDILYLPTKVKKDGDTLLICVRYGKGNKPAVKTGDEATFEGRFDRVALLGPALVDCKLIPGEDKGTGP